jgi:hypothetical protein
MSSDAITPSELFDCETEEQQNPRHILRVQELTVLNHFIIMECSATCG